MNERVIRFRVTAAQAGECLETLLCKQVDAMTEDEARALILAGAAYLDGLRARDASARVVAGQRVEIDRGAPVRAGRHSRHALEIVYLDPEMLVVEKPAGVASQGTREGDAGTVPALALEALASRSALRAALPLAIVHRLDQAASGLLVVARSRSAAAALSELFRSHAVERRYLAIVEPAPRDDACTIEVPIRAVGRGARVDPRGRPAVTQVAVTARVERRALIEATPQTGRLHQVRVHLSSIGCPIIGDRRYGGRPGPRLALHAARLAFVHPRTHERLVFDSPLPPSLASLLGPVECGV